MIVVAVTFWMDHGVTVMNMHTIAWGSQPYRPCDSAWPVPSAKLVPIQLLHEPIAMSESQAGVEDGQEPKA